MLWFLIALSGLFFLGSKVGWGVASVLVIVVVIAFWLLLKSAKKQAAAPKFVWPDLDEYGTHVVGESHYQPALKALAAGRQRDYEAVSVRAVLIPESDNPHDKNAVRVEIEGHKVGYLSRADAKRYRALVKKGYEMVPAECAAAITGGFVMDNGQQASFGVIVCIPPLE